MLQNWTGLVHGLMQVFNSKKSVTIFFQWEYGSFPFASTFIPTPPRFHFEVGVFPILIGFPFRSGFPFPWSLFTYHDTVDKVSVNHLKLSHADTTLISDINNIYRDVMMHSRRIALKSMPYESIRQAVTEKSQLSQTNPRDALR